MKKAEMIEELRGRIEYLDEATEQEALDDEFRNYTIIYNQNLIMKAQLVSLEKEDGDKINLADLKTVNIKDGDVLVAKVPFRAVDEDIQRVMDHAASFLTETFPENKNMVLPSDVNLGVYAKEMIEKIAKDS